MLIDNIRKLIANDENRTLELKKSTSELVKGMQTLCALLNTDGGWLVFGVTPKLEILGQNIMPVVEIGYSIATVEPSEFAD